MRGNWCNILHAYISHRHPTTGCTSTQTPQSAGEKWREMKFHWSDGFVLGDIVSCQRNERELLGLIKNFFFNEQVNKHTFIGRVPDWKLRGLSSNFSLIIAVSHFHFNVILASNKHGKMIISFQEGKVYVELEMLRRGNHSYFDNLFDEDELE